MKMSKNKKIQKEYIDCKDYINILSKQLSKHKSKITRITSPNSNATEYEIESIMHEAKEPCFLVKQVKELYEKIIKDYNKSWVYR
jgi:uncharacterized protein (UPF0335 family)